MTFDSPLHVLQDSGAPAGSPDYTTLVLLHGYSWHSGIFSKLIPLAGKYNVRIVLVNRRDYPGSEPLTDAERALLPSPALENTSDAAQLATALKNMETFMKDRARELYDFLVQLVKDGNIPAPDPENTKGGIILAGWSFGTGLITAFLANVASFPVSEVRLGDYMRRVVFLDPPHHVLGYPLPENPYNPLFDPTIPAEERERAFTNWVSGYYVHGATPDTLERKTPLLDPPPTLSTLTPEEISRTLSLGPGAPGGSDALLLHFGIKLGLYEPLRKGALYQPPQDWESGDALRDVEVRYVSCERSVWEMPWGTMYLEKELKEARAKGLPLRNVRLVFVKDANHFVQWDKPEHALRALVGDEDVVR
ncbi:alpha/beta-hydrolase [Trametes sanguinea]|nr:alpha/beta-hydrolase [Trametes sanguinea]